MTSRPYALPSLSGGIGRWVHAVYVRETDVPEGDQEVPVAVPMSRTGPARSGTWSAMKAAFLVPLGVELGNLGLVGTQVVLGRFTVVLGEAF